MRVRPENQHDAAAIRSVQFHAFNEHPYSYKDEYKIVEALRENNALTLSLVAEDPEDGVVGHVAVSPVLIDGKDEGWYYVGPIGVLPEHQKKGLGALLVKHAVRSMDSRGAEGLVSHGNPRFFKKLGFRNDSRITYNNVQPEHVVLLPLGTTVPEGMFELNEAYTLE